LPYCHKGREQIVCVRKYEDRHAWAIFIFNTTETPVHYSYPVRDLIGVGTAHFSAWKPQTITPLGQKETLEGDLKPHHSVLYYVSLKADTPNQNLGLNSEVILSE
jgi:hypothetical protein